MNRLIVLTIVIICTISAYSQNEDGVRNVDFLHENPPFSAFHTGVPIIRSIPPLSMSMPLDVLLGYIAMDSLGRFYNDSAFRAVRGKSLYTEFEELKPSNDTLHTFWKYWYQMMDFDPIRFQQYLNEQYLTQNNKYSFRFTYDVAYLLGKSHKLNHPLRRRIAATLIPDFILKVQVVGIDSMKAPIDSYGDVNKYKFYDIKCIVLDTLKGKIIPQDCESNNLIKNKTEQTVTNNCYFHFVISTNSYPQTRLSSHSVIYFPKIDSLIFDTEKAIMRVHNGQELIIFVNCINSLYTKTEDYFQIYSSPEASNGVLPIVNGMISDVNKIWSDSTWIPYETWKERYNEVVDIIMNKKY